MPASPFWISRKKARPAGQLRNQSCPKSVSKGRFYHPALEQLEDRIVLSTLELVTGNNPAVAPSDAAGDVFQARSSADGRYIAYTSAANNLISGQVTTAAGANVFLYDRQTQTTTLVSHEVSHANQTANGTSIGARISGDGRYVAFTSHATDLVAGQSGTFGVQNVFLYDQTSKTTILVSHTAFSSSAGANADSNTVDTTGFGNTNLVGRYLLFESAANNFSLSGKVGPSGPSHLNLFVYDAVNKTTQLVSHSASSLTTSANGDAAVSPADISGDGNFVTYTSLATNVVPNQSHQIIINPILFPPFTIELPGPDVFLYNRQTQTNTLVSGFQGSTFQAGGLSVSPIINRDGSVVVYASFDPAVNPDFDLIDLALSGHLLQDIQSVLDGQIPADLLPNLYLYDRSTGSTTLISSAVGEPNLPAHGASIAAAISADGNSVAFISDATDLVSGQGSKTPNAFLYDVGEASLSLISSVAGQPGVGAGGVRSLGITPGAQLSNIDNNFISISPGGRYVTYQSTASNLVSGESGNPFANTFRFDAQLGTNRLVSGVNGSATKNGNADSAASIVSPDGSVLLVSAATNLIDGVTKAKGAADVFLCTPGVGAPVLVTRSAFSGGAQAFVYSTSADGRYVVFTSNATNLVPGEIDNNADQNVYVFDRQTSSTSLVSHGASSLTQAANAGSPGLSLDPASIGIPAVISADGNYIAFASSATDLIAGQTGIPGFTNIFLYNRQTQVVTLVTKGASGPHAGGLGISFRPVINADGSRVAYTSNAKDLLGVDAALNYLLEGSAYYASNIFLYDRPTGTTTLVSADSSTQNFADASSSFASISDDGRFVAYQSDADDLIAGGTDPGSNVFVFDLTTQANKLVSHAFGSLSSSPNDTSFSAIISADGTAIAFVSYATDLVAGQSSGNGATNVFVYRNNGSGINKLVSGVNGSATTGGNGDSDDPVLDDDGSAISFRSDATNLVNGQNGLPGSNIFLSTVLGNTNSVTLVSNATGSATTTADGVSTNPAINGDGSQVVYLSTASNLVPGQTGGGVNNVFGWFRAVAYNFLASGVDGSHTKPSSSPTFLPIVSRDPIILFSVSVQLIPGLGGRTNGYGNSEFALTLQPIPVDETSAAGARIGIFQVETYYVSQLNPPSLAFPAGTVGNNGDFQLGPASAVLNNYYINFDLFTKIPVNLGIQTQFLISVNLDLKLEGIPPAALPFTLKPTSKLDAYVSRVYLELLGRNVDADGLIYWTGQLGQGVPRGALTSVLTHTPEYFATIIKPAYDTFLGRPADPGGLAHWEGQMAAGLTDEQLEAQFIASPEYYVHEGNTDKGWIDGIYRELLKRPPDAEGEAFWIAVAAQQGRYSVALGFAKSPEREKSLVESDYGRYLLRPSDPGGLAYWTGQFIGNAATNEDLIAGFVSSEEYYNRVTNGVN